VLDAKITAEKRVAAEFEELKKKLWAYAAEAIVEAGGKQYTVSLQSQRPAWQ